MEEEVRNTEQQSGNYTDSSAIMLDDKEYKRRVILRDAETKTGEYFVMVFVFSYYVYLFSYSSFFWFVSLLVNKLAHSIYLVAQRYGSIFSVYLTLSSIFLLD